jgi:LCP family protein required for cell wall assembly
MYTGHLSGAVSSFEQTRPHRPMDPAPDPPPGLPPTQADPPRRRRPWALLPAAVLGATIGVLLGAYLLMPMRTNILLLGIDSRPGETDVARTDTLILTTILPPRPYVGMLSIPRDLWVTVPGVGENRINTAHFFAEANQPGTGPQSAMDTVAQNFGVDVHHYVRIRFEGLVGFVDALGGVDVDLAVPMSGYEAGRHRLDGEQALAFVRDRKGSDDFFRMQRGQIFLRAAMRRLLNPLSWPRIPLAAAALAASIDTDVPAPLWPQLALAFVRAGPDGIDGRTIDRSMAQGFTTGSGAAVLAPRWEAINPVLLEMFGQ